VSSSYAAGGLKTVLAYGLELSKGLSQLFSKIDIAIATFLPSNCLVTREGDKSRFFLGIKAGKT
jgi:hypothetical protein